MKDTITIEISRAKVENLKKAIDECLTYMRAAEKRWKRRDKENERLKAETRAILDRLERM